MKNGALSSPAVILIAPGAHQATVGAASAGLAAGVPPQGTTAVLLASSQVDWFGPFPSSDMFGQMGLAQSTHLKYMLYNGWAIVVANIILFALLFQILV